MDSDVVVVVVVFHILISSFVHCKEIRSSIPVVCIIIKNFIFSVVKERETAYTLLAYVLMSDHPSMSPSRLSVMF